MPNVPADIIIRALSLQDAEAVLRVHHAAVHETAAPDYGPEVRQDWSPPVTPDRIDRYRGATARTEETTLVAVVDERVVGFASIVVALRELRAVYVSPEAGRRGVGSALLRGVEELAREAGVDELHLDSSLTAVAFYQKHGYLVDKHAEHVLFTGRRMPCVFMHKVIR